MRVVVRKGTAEDAPGLARLRWRWRVEERGERGDREMFLDFFTSWVLDHLATHVLSRVLSAFWSARMGGGCRSRFRGLFLVLP